MRINIYVFPLPFYLIILELSSATKFQLSWATHTYASWITSRRKKHCNQTDGAVPVVIMGGRNCPNILVSDLGSSLLELPVDFCFINGNPFPPRLLPCGLCWSFPRRAHEFLLAYKPRMSELITAAFRVVTGSSVGCAGLCRALSWSGLTSSRLKLRLVEDSSRNRDRDLSFSNMKHSSPAP